MLEPTTRRVSAVLRQWDGTRGYAETAQGTGYRLHREHLETPQPVRADINIEIYLDENERGETERMVFRPAPLAGESEDPSVRLPEHGRKLYADGNRLAWENVRHSVVALAVWYGINFLFLDENGTDWHIIALFFCAVLLINGLTLRLPCNRLPVWSDDEQGLWLHGSVISLPRAAQVRAYYFFDWRDIDAVRECRKRFGRRHWVLTVRRSAVAGDDGNHTRTSTDIKFYPHKLSRADQNTVRQCLNEHHHGKR